MTTFHVRPWPDTRKRQPLPVGSILLGLTAMEHLFKWHVLSDLEAARLPDGTIAKVRRRYGDRNWWTVRITDGRAFDCTADEGLAALKRKMGLLPEEAAPEVAARVETTQSAEELEMAELDAALEELKARESGR